MSIIKQQLLSIMERYQIGKKPLAKLLGWGDTTVMRYLNGVEPNREFAMKIQQLAENPLEYIQVLEQNKECITQTAYKKSKKAVYQQLFHDRSIEAMQYVITLADGDIAPYRVVSVLYYAQVCSLVLRGLPLFEEEANFSPSQLIVYPRLYEQMKQYGIRLLFPEQPSFLIEEQEYLKQVYVTLNGYSPNALKTLFVREKRRIRKNLGQEITTINHEILAKQYEEKFKKVGLKNLSDLKKYLSEALKSANNV